MSGLPYFIGELGHRDMWGTGLSFDQLVAQNTGVFFRAGLSRSEGETLTSHAWSGGVQHSPGWFGRPKDLVGIGYTFQHEAAGREHAAEVYYNVSLAACCQVIANVEWIFSGPNQVTGLRTCQGCGHSFCFRRTRWN